MMNLSVALQKTNDDKFFPYIFFFEGKILPLYLMRVVEGGSSSRAHRSQVESSLSGQHRGNEKYPGKESEK
jgi:hypothetical protein